MNAWPFDGLQKAELRCLLPRSLLDNGFYTDYHKDEVSDRSSFSWSGQRKAPSYLHKLVFPQEFMAALRTIKMQDHEIKKATSLLAELVGSIEEGHPSEADVRAAVWESCGDYAALELLVDLLRAKLMELEESSGTVENDSKLLEDFHNLELEEHMRENSSTEERKGMTRNIISCIVYRRGQKQLTSLFLKEAEQALEFCANEQE
ncbi:uncharacterized protein LOC110108064 [Dendrobium catenatum]|uniref:Rubisco LSMT substrate-binding domain-containing protein n=1 Tax=Dendrobium catenatum TaxID=906689 RepID=A0A2I0WE46_9ASPA|nr:uncharacterized protein LOC110108064 [Dendrobium catenatum]PKU73933.1 hypothetical protein MA16_Dca024560 [Dendrobium catenatum]